MLKNILRSLLASLLLAMTTYSQTAGDVSGDWQGTLTAGTAKLRLLVRIAKADIGWRGSLFSIDQSPDRGAGILIESIDLQDRNLKFRIAGANVSYEGTLSADRMSMT